jgi:hypothetical protein
MKKDGPRKHNRTGRTNQTPSDTLNRYLFTIPINSSIISIYWYRKRRHRRLSYLKLNETTIFMQFLSSAQSLLRQSTCTSVLTILAVRPQSGNHSRPMYEAHTVFAGNRVHHNTAIAALNDVDMQPFPELCYGVRGGRADLTPVPAWTTEPCISSCRASSFMHVNPPQPSYGCTGMVSLRGSAVVAQSIAPMLRLAVLSNHEIFIFGE